MSTDKGGTGARSPRWLRTATGFTGLGGVSWLASVLTDRTPTQPEDLTPAAVLPPEARQVTIHGEPVAIRELGTGDPAVIFIHGFAEHLSIWRPIQERIAQDHRTVALDLWGFAASARPPRLRPVDWVDEVTGVMDELGIQRAVLVGHSLGGRVSLMTARAHPERVAGMLLIDADWGQAPHGYVLLWLIAHTPALAWLLARIRSNPDHIRRVTSQVMTPNYPLTEEVLDGLQQPRRVAGSTACWRSLGRSAPLHDVRGLADHVHCPAHVLWGADDPVVPLWAGRKLARKLGAEITVFDTCGHFPQEEYPERTAEVVAAFLAGL